MSKSKHITIAKLVKGLDEEHAATKKLESEAEHPEQKRRFFYESELLRRLMERFAGMDS